MTVTGQSLRDADAGSVEHFPDVVAHRDTIANLLGESPSPVFVGDRQALLDRFATLDQALASRWPSHALAYSFKANYPVARSKILRDAGGWAEVVSSREYQMARELGHPGEQIVFNMPYKTRADLERAMVDGALIHVNDSAELELAIDIAAAGRETRRIGIRVGSNDVGLPRPTRFGFSLDDGEAAEALRAVKAATNLKLTGLHLHLLGNTDDVEVYRRASRKLGAFIREHVEEPLNHVDMGGGFPAHGPKPRSRTTWQPRPIEEYVAAITEELAPCFPAGRKPTLILEPGRYLVCDAIFLVTRVIRSRMESGRQVLVSNGAISMLPLIHYCPQVVRAFSPALEHMPEDPLETIVYGSSCREDDVLYEGPLARAKVGAYLIHHAAGAYNFNMSPDFIFHRPPLVFFS